MTLDEKLAKARRFKDPARRANAETRVLEEMAVRSPGEPMVRREKRPAGGGKITRGS